MGIHRRKRPRTRVMEEQGVVGPGVLDQPVHGAQDVLLGGLTHGVLLIVRQDDHVLPLVAEMLDEVGRHVPYVVDAAAELAALAKVVDADEQRFPSARAVGVSKSIALGRALPKVLGL